MKIQANRDFISPVYGNIVKGQVIEMTEANARQWILNGMGVEWSETKPEKKPDLADQSGSVSHQAQASQQKTVKKSGNGSNKSRSKGA